MNNEHRTPSQLQAINSNSPRILVSAGPGAGKSSTLVGRIQRLISDGIDPQRIAVVSFTNAASKVIEDRLGDVKLGVNSTLHGFALRILREFGRSLGYGDRISVISPESAEALLAEKARSLGCKEPIKKLLELKAAGCLMTGETTSRMSLPVIVVSSFLCDLRDAGLVDFDILLEEAAKLCELYPEAVGARYEHLLVDEVQDSSPTDWRIYRALQIPNKFWVGDSDQCQPAGTIVSMANGSSRSIETLKAGDRIMTYCRHSKVVKKDGIVSSVASRPYIGKMFCVMADGKSTLCTPNHRWLIKWPSGAQRTADNWCVYMMRKGDHFRIGKTRFFRSRGRADFIIGLPLRMRQEKADHGWILKVHSTESEATAYEQIVAAVYGLPEACFVSNTANRQFTQEVIDSIFDGIPNQFAKAVRCLQDHHREIDHPLFDRHSARTRRTVQEIRACNLIPEIMSIPIAEKVYNYRKRGSRWSPITINVNHFNGLVYSIDVAKDHKYIANGLVTCNSIYGFRGGAVQEMIREAAEPGTELILLSENFRSRSEICAIAQRLIEHNADRIEKPLISVPGAGATLKLMVEAQNEGEEIAIVCRAIQCLQRNDVPVDPNEIAVIGRTNAIVEAFSKTLAACKIPVRRRVPANLPKDFKVGRSIVELMADPDNDALSFLYLVAAGRTAREARSIVQRAQIAGCSVNKLEHLVPPHSTAAGASKVLFDLDCSREMIMLATEKLKDLPADASPADLALALAAPEETAKEEGSGVHCLTIHAAKGREFDAVFLVGLEDETIPGKRRDCDESEERRLLYVAITRARSFVGLSWSKSRVTPWGKIEAMKPSRFLSELGIKNE